MRLTASLVFAAALTGCGSVSTVPPETAPQAPINQRSVPSELLNHDVRQDTIGDTICVPGYAASIRPSTSFAKGVKTKLMRETGMPLEAAASLELDHRVALSVGGHPRNLRNLALQPLDGEEGAKRKGRLEKRLQVLVCAQQMSLAEAQWALYADWQAAYRSLIARP